MFIVHQIVNVLISPVFLVLLLLVAGLIMGWRGRARLGRWLLGGGVVLLFLMSWPAWKGVTGRWRRFAIFDELAAAGRCRRNLDGARLSCCACRDIS